ncbi:MAG: heavy metal-binding domain-containing protein, partial [Candidatus Levybacteria bacterium]|nr:heavy metal-binding domain-containing protein [Candidatus Levybacteria bacterium]
MNVGSDSLHRGVHAGTSYLFCSAHCLSEFRQDPGKYTGTAPAEGEHEKKEAGPDESGASGAESRVESSGVRKGEGGYTCPMHPEIVRDAPGSCPKCGMALEPRTDTAGEEENP